MSNRLLKPEACANCRYLIRKRGKYSGWWCKYYKFDASYVNSWWDCISWEAKE